MAKSPNSDSDLGPEEAGQTDSESTADESQTKATGNRAPSALEKTGRERDTKLDDEAEAIIRSHVTYSMMGGAIPIPLFDLTALTAVQLDLIKQLARCYRIPFESSSARAFLTSLGSAVAGRTLARLGAASVSKLIPGLGTVAGVVAGATLNGAFTFAVGNVVGRHFATGLPLEELDARGVKDEFGKLFEAGKTQASQLYDTLKGGQGKE